MNPRYQLFRVGDELEMDRILINKIVTVFRSVYFENECMGKSTLSPSMLVISRQIADLTLETPREEVLLPMHEAYLQTIR